MPKKQEDSIIKCQKVEKSYGKNEVLHDVNLSLSKGKIIGLLGPNGSGKTTLIKLLNGLLIPTSGAITIKGYHPGIETKEIVAYLSERNSLDLNMSIRELIRYFEDFYADFEEAKAYELLERLHIDTKAKLKTMSKGTREKVQLILTMSRRAELYILDEPIGGVDPATRDYILDTILTSFKEEATILISTHLISDVERILDEVIFLNQGRVILTENADQLRERKGQSIDEIFREEFKC